MSASGAIASRLETLTLEGCMDLLELPETVGPKFARLQLLNLHGCKALLALPHWVARMEKESKALIRPEHLR